MGMPVWFVYIGDNMEKMDAVLNDHAKRQRVLRDMQAGIPLVDIFVANGANFTRQGERLLREKWFNPAGWWPEYQPVEEISRQGYIDALHVAMRDPDTGVVRPLPIHSYWTCANGSPFAVCVAWSDTQVTRILMTPPHPPLHHGPLTRELPMYLTTRTDPGVPITHERLRTTAHRPPRDNGDTAADSTSTSESA